MNTKLAKLFGFVLYTGLAFAGASFLNTATAQDYQKYGEYDTSGLAKASIGINIGINPSIDFGYGVTERHSVHLKGGFMQNLFKAPSYYQTWFVNPAFRWWITERDGMYDRFFGLYAELGVVYADMDIYNEALVKDPLGSGAVVKGFGVTAGFGYSFKVSDHFSITPTFNGTILLSGKRNNYRMYPNGDGDLSKYAPEHITADVRKTGFTKVEMSEITAVGLPLPLEAGIKFNYIF